MALPYPYEAETGQLSPRPAAARAPFDIAGHIREAIVARGSAVELFGVEFPVDAPELAATMASGFREALTQHFLERHPMAGADIWDSFASQAQAQLKRGQTLGDSSLETTLNTLLMTVDGL
jgi:hypothetical protein